MEESVAEHKGELLDHGAITEAETQEHDTEEALEAAEAVGENEAVEESGDAEAAEDAGEAPVEEGETAEAESAEAEAAEESGDVEVAEEEAGDQTMEDEVKAIFGDSDEEDNENQGDQDNVSAGEEDEEHIEESTRKLKRLVKQRSRKHTSDDDEEHNEEEEETPKKKKKRLSKKKRNAIEEDEGEGEGEEKKKKKRKKKKKAEEGGEGAEGGEGGEVADDGNDEDEAPRRRKQEEFEEFDQAMARLKHKRVKKDLTAEEEAKLTETVNNFITKMEAAAKLDEEANRNKQPATNKVASLKNVVDNLQKTRFADAFVNQGGFAAIRKWLQPLPDKSLPSLNIREQLLAVLDTLPFNKELLQNSEVGKVIMFLWKSPNENPKNKRICAKIIEKWSRPIFGLNTAYRERDRGDDEELERPSRRAKVEEDENEIDRLTREKMKDNRKFHARIPQRIFMDFKKMPVAEVKATPAAKNPHVAAAEADKKIKQKRRTKPSSSNGRVLRAERISVEGRMVK